MKEMTKNVERLPYKQGDWFAVPLEAGGYCLGFAARVDGRGCVIGYFFGPRRTNVPSAEDICCYEPDDAILVEKFGDLGLLEGKWPVIGPKPACDPLRWPMPIFRREDPLSGKVVLIRYDETNLVKERPASLADVDPEKVIDLPRAGLSGYIAVERALSMMLRGETANHGESGVTAKIARRARKLRPMEYYFYFPSESSAEDAAKTLRQLKHDVQIRRGADGNSWLLLAGCEFIPAESELVMVETAMRRIAEEHGGDYDGWEAAVDDNIR